MFDLGFSTYAMKKLDPFTAINIIANTGYKYVEICVADDWPSSPLNFNRHKQKKLLQNLNDLGLVSNHTFGFLDICDKSDKNLDNIKMKFDMANVLNNTSSKPILTSTLGNSAPNWESGKNAICEELFRVGELAYQNGIFLAIEPHAGTDFESPEKALWLIRNVNHENISLDLDISHFVVEGHNMSKCFDLCAQISSVIHIKDGYKVNNQIHYCLTGDGQINVEKFFMLIKNHQLEKFPVFSEVSLQQSLLDIYDPEVVAKYCFNVLDKAKNNIT